MLNPYSLLPLALAARDGRVDDHAVQQLVAAGITLLQRSAPLVRALSGRRAGILLPTSSAFFVALAASEGRAAVLIDPLAEPTEISYQVADAGVGAVFTTSALAAKLPADVPHALLDDAPRIARTVIGGSTRDVDLGSHHGLSIEGDVDVPGSDDDAAMFYTSITAGPARGTVLSHRNLLANARSTNAAAGNTDRDRVLALLPFTDLFGLTAGATAPLLAGAHVVTMSGFAPERAVELTASGQITQIVGDPAAFRALLSAMERGARPARVGVLRLSICGGSSLPVELQDRWYEVTGSELRQWSADDDHAGEQSSNINIFQ